MIRVACPNCGKSFGCDDKYVGATGKCTECGKPIQVPKRAAAIQSEARQQEAQEGTENVRATGNPLGMKPEDIATGSLVLGIAAVLCPVFPVPALFAVILGHIALGHFWKQYFQPLQRNRLRAVAGLGLGYAGALLFLVGFIAYSGRTAAPPSEPFSIEKEFPVAESEPRQPEPQRPRQASFGKPSGQNDARIPPHRILQKSDFLEYKISLDVEIMSSKASLPNKQQLAALSKKLYNDYNGKKYERVFICYYLPGMVLDNGAWATGHFNAVGSPGLEVKILGIAPDFSRKALKDKPKVKPGETLVGRWLMETSRTSCIVTFVEEDGELKERREFDGGGVLESRLIVKDSGGEKRYERDNNRTGEYWVIDDNGDLCLYDSDGLYVVCAKR